MFISVKSIIASPEFKGVKIIAGAEGLHKNITSIGVNDFRVEYMSQETMGTGDLFISSLHQYSGETDEKCIEGYIQTLIDNGASGLVIVSSDNIKLITERIKEKCDRERFPLLYFPENKRYVDIMEAVNKYIAIETYNASRMYRIQKILSENLSEEDVIALLDSFESDIQPYIAVIAFSGKPASDILKKDFEVKALSSARDAFVECNYLNYYIVSDKDVVSLKKHINLIKNTIREYYDVRSMGISKAFEKRSFKQALIESNNANRIAKATDCVEFSFPRISSYGIIAAISDNSEAKEYYNSVIEVIDEHTSAEHRDDVLNTVAAFVKYNGDFKLTAEAVNQHENTVRYRLNKLREWMEMDGGTIAFYETISLISKLYQFYK